MASYSTIRFNFAQAKQQAQRLETIAYEMKRTANQNFDRALSQLSGSWKGESATLYIKKAQIVRNEIIKNANDLEAVARSIRKVAQRVYNAEMEAKRLAEEIARKG
ncbi:MAG: hypothetical protein IJS03_05075 [Eubacterium sp.]|nr:hypothetical protein [Eubacterium sp.]